MNPLTDSSVVDLTTAWMISFERFQPNLVPKPFKRPNSWNVNGGHICSTEYTAMIET